MILRKKNRVDISIGNTNISRAYLAVIVGVGLDYRVSLISKLGAGVKRSFNSSFDSINMLQDNMLEPPYTASVICQSSHTITAAV